MKRLINKRILIADDDEGMLRALDKVLTAEGAVVTAKKWAGDAIEVLTQRQTTFDLVITDLRMPLVTGLTLVHSIREIFPGLPVIVLTAFGNAVLEAECLQLGARVFLEKPLNSRQLLDSIERVFDSSPAGEHQLEAAGQRPFNPKKE